MVCLGKCSDGKGRKCECIADPHPSGVDNGLATAPKSRLCRTGMGFLDSTIRSKFCSQYNKMNTASDKSTLSDFRICPMTSFKKTWFTIPTVLDFIARMNWIPGMA